MNRRILTYALVTFFAYLQVTAVAQYLPDEKVLNMMDFFAERNYGERVFIETDRELYLAGNDLRLSVFVLESSTMQPRALSSIVSIELLDNQNQVIISEKCLVKQSRGALILKLPMNLQSGFYTLRAYTNWMRNGSEKLFFHKRITIIHPARAPIRPLENAGYPEISFHPEGGAVVEGTENRIVFRVSPFFQHTERSSLPVVTGDRDTIQLVRLDDQGIGDFNLEVRTGTTAGILINDSIYPVPAADPEGLALRTIRGDNGTLSFRGTTGRDRPSEELLHMVIHRGGRMFFFDRTEVKEHRFNIEIRKKLLPTGIYEVIWLDHNLVTVGSRLIHNAPEGEVPFLMHPLEQDIGKRDSVNIDFETVPGAHVSISVYLPGTKRTAVNPTETSFLNQLGLPPNTDDLALDAGMILSGSYYDGFKSAGLQQGFTFPPELRGQMITGKIVNGGLPLPEYNLYMAKLGKNADPEKVILQEDGSFYITPTRQQQSEQLVFLNDSLEKLNIMIQPVFSERYSKAYLEYLDPGSFPFTNIEKLLVAQQVSDLYTNAEFSEPSITSYKFYGQADESIQLGDYIRLPNMEEFFRELVKTSIFTRENGVLKLNVLSKYTNRIIGPDPMYLVDGIPVFATETILGFDPELIASIHVVANKYIYGNLVMDGIIDIETKSGDASILQMNENIASYQYQPALDLSQEEIEAANNTCRDDIPDQRTVICWQPRVECDTDGKGTCTFVSSDITGVFDVRCTVVSPDGRILTFYDSIEVK